MIAEIESTLGMFVDPPEENPRCHEVLDRLITLNDLFQIEHKDQLNQILQQDINLQQHCVDIDARQIESAEKEAKVQEREHALEEKWNKFSEKLMNSQNKCQVTVTLVLIKQKLMMKFKKD